MICIDAGHGFSDVGAVGGCGAQEKDVVLKIAHHLHAMLPGSLLTRTTDEPMSLSDRAAFANEMGAELFVSIHCNGHDSDAEGIETFHHPNSKEGGKLAKEVQESLMESFRGHKDRGVKTASFQVLRETKMPAILIECEFITSRHWCSFLQRVDVQQDYAKAIARGIRKYLGNGSGPVYRVTVDGKSAGSFTKPQRAVESALKLEPGRIEIERLPDA